jgi:plastocyanin
MRKIVLLPAALAIVMLNVGPAQGNPGGHGGVTIQAKQYAPKDISVPVGTAVNWTNNEAIPHSVTADDASFDSHPTCGKQGGACLKQGEKFTFTFSKPGRYAYYCRLHGAPGGAAMAGTVTVT